MPPVHVGNVDAAKYEQATINLKKVAGEVLFAEARTLVNVSEAGGKLYVNMPSTVPETRAWPGRGECVCPPPSQALTELGFAHVPECVQNVFGARELSFVLVYTTDLNVFLMLVPILRVGAEDVALFPWNGYCEENGERDMVCGKTFIQAACGIEQLRAQVQNTATAQGLGAERTARLLGITDSYALLLQQFQQKRRNLHAAADQSLGQFSAKRTYSGFMTYTSVTPGVLLTVGHANYLISHGDASEELCLFVIDSVLAFTTDHYTQTPHDEVWVCFLAMFFLKLAHQAAGVCSYRLEKGEDIRPDFSPYVYGTTGDCEDHMGAFLTIMHTIARKNMLRDTVFERAQLTPDNPTRAFAARGVMKIDDSTPDEIHAFTVLARPQDDGGVRLHIVENTSCVFVYSSDEQRDAVARALAPYDRNMVSYQTEAKMRDIYSVHWLDKRLVFVFEAGGSGAPTLTRNAVPYFSYASMCVFDFSSKKLCARLAALEASPTRRQHLVLVHPVLFLRSIAALQQYAACPAGSPGAERCSALAEYLDNTEVLEPWWRVIFAERKESMDEAARGMRAALEREHGIIQRPAYDLRLLPRVATGTVDLPPGQRPPLLEVVRSTLHSALQTLQKTDHVIRAGLCSQNACCICIVEHIRLFFRSIDTFSGYYHRLIKGYAHGLQQVLTAYDNYQRHPYVMVSISPSLLHAVIQDVLTLIYVITHCLNTPP